MSNTLDKVEHLAAMPGSPSRCLWCGKLGGDSLVKRYGHTLRYHVGCLEKHRELPAIDIAALLRGKAALPPGTRIMTARGQGASHELRESTLSSANDDWGGEPFWLHGWRDLHESLMLANVVWSKANAPIQPTEGRAGHG